MEQDLPGCHRRTLPVGSWRAVFLCAFISALSVAPEAEAVPVPLRAVAATAPAKAGHPLDAAVDGVLAPDNGWSLESGRSQHQFAVFATDKPIAATMYELRFYFLGPTPAYLLRFGISVTADASPSLAGHWMPLLPEQATCNFSNSVTVSGAIVRLRSNRGGTVVTLRARAPFMGVTGFRLRMRTAQPEGQADALPVLGSAADGDFMLTEFEAEAEPLHTSNIALGCQVYSSGLVPRELPKQNLTDGLVSTYSRPDPKVRGQDFYFFLDLGRVVEFDHLVIRGRANPAPEERLGDYRVEILADTDETIRSVQWQTVIHHGRLHPAGDDGPDVIRANDGAGTFAGNGIRIYNQGRQDLEIAEIEVYPALKPEVSEWVADDMRLSGGKEVAVPPVRHRLGFTIKSREPGVYPVALTYAWRIPKWSESWRETGPDGRVEFSPPPPAGLYELQVQANHSDGVRDSSGRSLSFRIAPPWWRSPRDLAVLLGCGTLLTGAFWWRLAVRRVNRRLALAEQHLARDRERLRIARDMHDDIGARLTYMAFLADRAVRTKDRSEESQSSCLSTLAENARAAINALDNIVWAVNPRHDTVGSLADYLCDYAPTYLEAAAIPCRLAMQIEHPQRPLNLTTRHGLLMAIKEALQNVVKHAHAQAVRLAVSDKDGQLEVRIADDGLGLNEKAETTGGRGLENMRQRLAEIGGRCEILSPPDQRGTSIRLIVPMTENAVAERVTL